MPREWLREAQPDLAAEKILDAAHRRAAKIGEDIREMRGVRTRLAEALRTTLETHRTHVDRIQEASQGDEELAEVMYLARSSNPLGAAHEQDTGETSLG